VLVILIVCHSTILQLVLLVFFFISDNSSNASQIVEPCNLDFAKILAAELAESIRYRQGVLENMMDGDQYCRRLKCHSVSGNRFGEANVIDVSAAGVIRPVTIAQIFYPQR
jgi:hypothetical protein